MGLGGFFKGLGKGLLKAAPFAAYAIPGVGPVAGALLQAGLGAANSAASGGGWKGALLGAGTGAASSAAGGLLGKIPGVDKIATGLAPSSGVVKSAVGDVASRAAGGGFKSALGNIGKQMTGNILKDVAARGIGNLGRPKPQDLMMSAQSDSGGLGPSRKARKRMEIRTPNLAHPLLAGRNEALRQYGLPPIEEMDYVNV